MKTKSYLNVKDCCNWCSQFDLEAIGLCLNEKCGCHSKIPIYESTYAGRLVSEMTREELIKALENMGRLYQESLAKKIERFKK